MPNPFEVRCTEHDCRPGVCFQIHHPDAFNNTEVDYYGSEYVQYDLQKIPFSRRQRAWARSIKVRKVRGK